MPGVDWAAIHRRLGANPYATPPTPPQGDRMAPSEFDLAPHVLVVFTIDDDPTDTAPIHSVTLFPDREQADRAADRVTGYSPCIAEVHRLQEPVKGDSDVSGLGAKVLVRVSRIVDLRDSADDIERQLGGRAEGTPLGALLTIVRQYVEHALES